MHIDEFKDYFPSKFLVSHPNSSLQHVDDDMISAPSEDGMPAARTDANKVRAR